MATTNEEELRQLREENERFKNIIARMLVGTGPILFSSPHIRENARLRRQLFAINSN